MRALFSALAFLTIVPIPWSLQSRRENAMFPAFPPAGLLIGLFLSAVFWVAGLLFPLPVAAVILIAATLLLTGGLHLDGLADCADAFYGVRDREKILSILKDPRIGTMGGGAIALSLLARFAAFSAIPFPLLALGLPVATLLSRGLVLVARRLLPYVRSEGGILSADPGQGRGVFLIGIIALLCAASLLPLPSLASLAAASLFWRLSWKRIGGCTGDVLGATIEIAEIAFILTLALSSLRGWSWGLLSMLVGGWLPGIQGGQP
jgi:adenosylcobinamide-GDP ribazoletransferase